MKLTFKTKPTLITTIILLTLLLTWLAGYVVEDEMRNDLLLQTKIGANSVDASSIKNLTGTVADLKSPDYLRLKQQLANIMKVDKHLHFAYLMGVKNNGTVFFYVDDKPDGHPDGSPPGSLYEEAPKEFNRVLQTGTASVEGPSSDSWGSFVSASAPVIDPKTGKTIAIFTIDFATGSWYWKIISRSAIPVGLLILLMLGIFSTLVSRRRGELLKKSEEKYRFMFDNNPQPNWIYDLETLSFVEVNEAAIQHYGYSKEEFLSMTLKDIRPPEDIASLLENVNQTRNLLNNSGECRHIKKDGQLIFVEIISHSFTFNGREARHVLVHDITDRKLADIMLHEEKDRIKTILNLVGDPIFVKDNDHSITMANQAFYDILCLDESKVIGFTLGEAIPENEQHHFLKIDRNVLDTGILDLREEELTVGGNTHHIITRKTRFIDKSGNRFLVGSIHDITERKKAEEALHKSRSILDTAMKNMTDAIIISDKNGRFIEFNDAFATFHKFTDKAECLKHMDDFHVILEMYTDKGEVVPYDMWEVPRALRGEIVTNAEYRLRRKDTGETWVGSYSFSPIRNENGKIIGTVVVGRDITKSKKAEDALKQANDELEKLHNNLDVAVFSIDMIHNKMIYASFAHLTLFGYAPTEFINNPKLWYEIILPEDKSKVDAGFPALISGEKISIEYRIVHPNGKISWIETKMNPTLDENGKPTRMDGIASDITKRKLIENELLESEINFRRSIADSPVGIRIVSVEGKTIYANKAFLDIYEFSNLEEFNSSPAIKRYTPESYVQHQVRKKRRKEGVEVFDYEISIICTNDDIRHVKVSRKEVLWNGIQHFQVINLNITEQRNAEEKLRKLSIAVEQSPDAICITDTDGIIEYVNPRTIELTGYSIEELIGQKTNIFSSGEKAMEEYALLWETIKLGNVWSGELHNKKKNGELYWESTSISPIFDKENQITNFLAIKEDVTERKRMDIALNNSEEQLHKFASHLQNVREEEKVALAREIHDDLGQILVALKIDMGLLKQKIIKTNTNTDSEEVLPEFENIDVLINNTIKTARRIMNGLRPELLELYGFVGATKEYLREFEERHHISCKFACDIPNLDMNQQQSLAFFRILQEAMNNIVKHARATLVKIQLSIEDHKLIMEIIDNGVGFDKNNSGRQDSYGMIGMKERVVLLKGELDITSTVGQGTCIRVEIPYVIKQLF